MKTNIKTTLPSGIVFDIQRYSLHDGPGIRTVVFLKGCPLRCKWCSNPESLAPSPQPFFVRSRCIRCGRCAAERPVAITMDENGPIIDFAAADKGDLSWTNVCPTGALSIKGKEMSVSEVMEAVLRDEAFYRQSGGGMTLSGGEPLLQGEFAQALLKQTKAEVISTAVETTGDVPLETLLSVAPYTDLFLYDYKALDETLHKQYTNRPNGRILSNLKELAGHGADILVRMPLIPGVNDSPESLDATLSSLKALGITRFALLPFHQYGSGKYVAIGSKYTLDGLAPPLDEKVGVLRSQISAMGFTQA